MKTSDLLKLALLAAAVYFIYDYLKKSPFTQKPAGWIADFYTWLTLPPALVLNGNLSLPDGSLVPLSSADIRQNGANVVVAEYSGHFYQLQPSDSDGNWPAILIQ